MAHEHRPAIGDDIPTVRVQERLGPCTRLEELAKSHIDDGGEGIRPRTSLHDRLRSLPLTLWRMKGVSTNIRLLARAYAGMLFTANAS